MTKKRDLKTKFRHFSNTSHKRNESPAAKSSPDESNVTARLIKLRVEQTRAERNRQQRNNGQQAIDLAQSQSQWHDLGQVVARPKPELRRRTAGPPPPQSWIAKDKELTERFQNEYIRQRKKHSLQPWQQAVPPLWELCAHIICKQINVWYSSSDRQACMQQITRLPISTKQILLKAFSAENSETTLTDKLLPMFGGEEYRELCLEGAAISMECLVRTFWNIKSHQTVPLSVTDDWEEVAEQGIADTFGANGEYLYDPEQHSECTWHLRPLLHMAANQRSPAAIDLAKQYILYTPLAAKLTTLNLSFIQPPLPAISLAYLITQTLPDLRILSVAGTFPGKHDGPHALSILSRSLRKLIAWDIGYHPWLETSMLCDDTSPSPMIHWNRDLPNLQELSLECCGASQDERVGEQVKEWLRDHYGNRKINIVHASG